MSLLTLPTELLLLTADHLSLPSLSFLILTSRHFQTRLTHALYTRGLRPTLHPTILDWSLTHARYSTITHLLSHHPTQTSLSAPLLSRTGLAKRWYTWSNSAPTPLLAASFLGATPIVRHLLSLGAPTTPREPEDHETPLHAAARKGFVEIITLLLDAGADIEARTKQYGWTPLWVAAHCHMWEPGVRKEDTLGAIRVLVGRGADTEGTDSAGDAPLFEAVASGYVAAVRVLLECGADANAKDGEGGSVLHRAAGKGDVADVKVLLVFGADVGALVSVKGGVGRTPLEVYRECKRDYLAYLEQQGWDGGERIYGFGGGGGREMMRLLGGTAEELADSDGGMV